MAQLIKIEASVLNKLRLNATNDRSMHVCPLGILVFFDFGHLKLNEFLVISFNNLCFSYLNSAIFSNFTFIYYEGHAHPRHGNGESLILLITWRGTILQLLEIRYASMHVVLYLECIVHHCIEQAHLFAWCLCRHRCRWPFEQAKKLKLFKLEIFE